MFGVVYEILESSCKNYMYVVVHFVVGMEKLVLLVSTTIFLSWQRQKKKHHVHAVAGWAMLILNGASAVSFTTQKCLENKYPDWDIWDILYYLGLGTKCPRRAPLLPILNGKCRPTTCGG